MVTLSFATTKNAKSQKAFFISEHLQLQRKSSRLLWMFKFMKLLFLFCFFVLRAKRAIKIFAIFQSTFIREVNTVTSSSCISNLSVHGSRNLWPNVPHGWLSHSSFVHHTVLLSKIKWPEDYPGELQPAHLSDLKCHIDSWGAQFNGKIPKWTFTYRITVFVPSCFVEISSKRGLTK